MKMLKDATTRNESIQSSLNSYLMQIRNDRLLTAAEEHDLSRKILRGDQGARERLINSNLRLVVKIAKGYISHDMDLLDLIQEGNLGLIRAAEKFDFRKNVRFSTYASFWIKQSIARALSNKSRMIRLPHRKEEKLRKITRACNKLSKDTSAPPDLRRLSEETSIEEGEISSIMKLPDRVLSMESADEKDGFSLQHVVEDPKYNPDYIVMRNYLRSKTREMLDILTEKERKVILYRYSFINAKKHTLKDVGEKLNISPETVRQVEMRALRKIREHFSDFKVFLFDR
jgi:RNA polymerase primary sigma factor